MSDENRCVGCGQRRDIEMVALELAEWVDWGTTKAASEIAASCRKCFDIEFQIALIRTIRLMHQISGRWKSDEHKFIATHDLDQIYAGKYLLKPLYVPLQDGDEWTPHECKLRKTGKVKPLRERAG